MGLRAEREAAFGPPPEAPAVDHLLEFLDRPPWQRDALCREYAGDATPPRGRETLHGDAERFPGPQGRR